MKYAVKCHDRETRKDLDGKSFNEKLEAVGYFGQLLDKYPDQKRYEIIMDMELEDYEKKRLR